MERLLQFDIGQSNRDELVVELAQQKLALDEHSIVGITDITGTIIYANDKFCAISGYSKQELLGQNHRILNSGFHSKDFFKEMYKTISRGDTWHGEIRNKTKTGEYYWVETTIVPFKDLLGHVTKYISIRTDITAFKEAEKKLTHINRHLTEYVENANLCLHWLSPDGRIIWANKTELNLLGYSREEYIGRPFTEFHLDKEVAKNISRHISRGEPLAEIEALVKAKDGSNKSILISCNPFRDNRQYLYSRCFTIDVTAKKQAEMELSMFFNISPDFHCIADRAGYFKRVNLAFTKVLGWSQEELLSKPITEFIIPEDRHRTQTRLENINTRTPVRNFENRYLCSDGSFKTISWCAIPNDNGKWYATGRDISLEKLAIENLRQSEEHLATTLRTITEAVIAINKNHEIERINGAAERLLGLSQASSFGRPIEEILKLFIEGTAADVRIPLDQIIQFGGTYKNSDETSLINRKGQSVEVDINITPLPDAQGNPIGAVIVLRDVSEDRRQKRVIKRQAQVLKEVKTVQDLFIQNPSSVEAFEYTLSVLLRFTQSEYGFVGEVLYDVDGNPFLKTHAITNIAWTDELRNFYEQHAAQGLEFKNLKTLFGHVLKTGEPMISNSPGSDPRRGGLPSEHPSLNAFLGLPVFHDTKIIGMIGAANKPGGYDNLIIDELQPLLSTYANLIQSRRTRISQKLAEQTIQEQSTLLSHKQNLIQEVHHRVKNNLQIISSLLNLQENQESAPEVAQQLQSSRTRIAAVALLHEILYRSESIEVINLAEFLNELLQRLRESFGVSAAKIQFRINVPKEIMLSQNQAGPLALIINELATNSLKHAFPVTQSGIIEVDVQLTPPANATDSPQLIVDISDDGVGINSAKKALGKNHLGSKIIMRLAQQLRGRLMLESVNKGTKWRLTFPQKLHAQ
jgi:PAS domain S-box-containing protein